MAYLLLLLLLLLLVVGEAELQRHNVTEERLNHTLAATAEPPAATLRPYGDVGPLTEDELRGNRTSNQTASFMTEEEEGFQDQENQFPWQHCLRYLLVQLSDLCGDAFHADMSAVSADDRCVLENVIRPYNELTLCLETASHLVGCYFPNADVQDFFLRVHAVYFRSCGGEEPPLEDAPYGLVVVLTLAPVSLIPLLVYMVAWKSKAAP